MILSRLVAAFVLLLSAGRGLALADSQVKSFQVKSANPAAWKRILGSIGLVEGSNGEIVVIDAKAGIDNVSLAQNHIVILQGPSPLAEALGITSLPEQITVRQALDTHAPNMQIFWEQPVAVRRTDLTNDFQVFARERWKGIPLLAGKRTVHGAILWMATDPGPTGIERYPYLLNALTDLGLTTPVKATNLWAFFDSSYRVRADVEYLAQRWRHAGIGALHVAAWHNAEPDAAQDQYLKSLIEACHRNAILVYAWLELPHVSDRFWDEHPEWREKTALGQDAQLDWRKLMNLEQPDCHRAVAASVNHILDRFDWDGVNLAELYFESLEGPSNPARFTPMNDDVRREFAKGAGFDPKFLFDPASEYAAGKNPQGLRRFLDYRASLTARMQSDWLKVIDQVRISKPYLDVVLTHIDDRFEPGIKDALGADVARSLPMMRARRSTLLVEDPATIWNLGSERYSKLAEKYNELTPDRSQIAVDINVVERYQDVYPTKKQTGVELLELVHQAAASFQQVALYFENSLEKQDLGLLPAAASTAKITQPSVDELDVNATQTTRVAWQGSVEIDGKLWPIQNSQSVLAPIGNHRLRPGMTESAITISDFNGEIRSASVTTKTVDLSYTSRCRAIAMMGSPVSSIEVDGAPFWNAGKNVTQTSILLPAGQHFVTFIR